ncbi:MAG: hypothetical protein KDJ16_18175 [Hyphomicrobiales bacterium]|nr:hypothetical protein [Hyphomicrobiales bacterium]
MNQATATLDCTKSGADPGASGEGAPFVGFSIASRNYICFVNTLYDSLVRQYGSVRFFLALADSDADIDRSTIPYEILSLADLEDDRLWGMAEHYNITEFNTSIKPYVFAQLMDRFPGEPILYFDPDIFVVSRLREIEQAFEDGANAVLTPHLIDPLDHPLSRDEDLLKYGIYNFGFVGLRSCPEAAKLASWWCDRMENRCLIDFPNGLFVDQKWGDFLPAYLSNTYVLRHPGYNVAYWNLPDRRVRLVDGRWICNGQDLRFAHFSGVDILNPAIYSRHAANFHHTVVGDLGHLLELYREKVLQGGLKRYGRYEYAFRYSGASGAVNVHTAVSLSDKIKGDTGAVDHALPAFGPQGKTVANSVGQTAAAPELLAASVRDGKRLAAWEDDNAEVLEAVRDAEAIVLAETGGVAVTGGVCAMCRTTGPFLAVTKSGAKARTCDWGETLTCRCGHSADSRALVHAARSIAGVGLADVVLVDAGEADLLSWARLHWPKTEALDGSQTRAHCILTGAPEPGVLKTFVQRLMPDGLLAIAGKPVASAARGKPPQINFSMLDALAQAGFADVDCIVYASVDLGYLGERTHLFVARAPGGRS